MKLFKEFCKESFSIKLVFDSFKIKNYCSYKYPIPDDFKYFLVQKVITKDRKSHIFKHMHSTIICFNSYNYPYFKTIHKANSKFDLKIKEAFYTDWRKPNLNAQQNDLALTHSLKLPSSLCCFLYLSFAFIFYVSFSLSLTLIIGIFYCLNYPLLLLHFIIPNQRAWYQNFFFHSCFFFTSGTKYWRPLLSEQHLAIASFRYNTTCKYILY